MKSLKMTKKNFFYQNGNNFMYQKIGENSQCIKKKENVFFFNFLKFKNQFLHKIRKILKFYHFRYDFRKIKINDTKDNRFSLQIRRSLSCSFLFARKSSNS